MSEVLDKPRSTARERVNARQRRHRELKALGFVVFKQHLHVHVNTLRHFVKRGTFSTEDLDDQGFMIERLGRLLDLIPTREYEIAELKRENRKLKAENEALRSSDRVES